MTDGFFARNPEDRFRMQTHWVPDPGVVLEAEHLYE